MYRLYYYMTGGSLTSKLFDNLHDAIVYSIYKIGFGNFEELIKEKYHNEFYSKAD